MIKRFQTAGLPLVLITAITWISGCCGIADGPKSDVVRGWLDSMPKGISGADAFALLKDRGFAPEYYTPQRILGHHLVDRCIGAIWVDVEIDLDTNGRVISYEVSDGQDFP
jgi:hypothetical protein